MWSAVAGACQARKPEEAEAGVTKTRKQLQREAPRFTHSLCKMNVKQAHTLSRSPCRPSTSGKSLTQVQLPRSSHHAPSSLSSSPGMGGAHNAARREAKMLLKVLKSHR